MLEEQLDVGLFVFIFMLSFIFAIRTESEYWFLCFASFASVSAAVAVMFILAK